MAIDPKKLAALINRETESPMKGLAGDDDDLEGLAGDDEGEEEGENESEGDGGESVPINLTEREIETIIELVEDGEGDPELMKLGQELREALEEAQEGVDEEGEDYEGAKPEELNPPAWVGDEAIWEKAKMAVDPEGEGSKYEEPYAVVAHVYDRMGGKRK